jgi:hypothetical protein
MPARKLGFAVNVLSEPDLPSHDTRRWQSGPHLCVSLERLRRIFDYLARARIVMYRFTRKRELAEFLRGSQGVDRGQRSAPQAACRLISRTRTGSELEPVPDAADGGLAQDDLEQDAGATDD